MSQSDCIGKYTAVCDTDYNITPKKWGFSFLFTNKFEELSLHAFQRPEQ